MKNKTSWSWFWTSLLVGFLLGVSLPAYAQHDEASKVWIRLTVGKAKIWPVNAKGTCWDPCGWSSPTLPQRRLKPYSWYLKFPEFVKMTKGWHAPDTQLVFRFGATLWKTKVISDTTQPVWNETRLIRLGAKERFSLEVLERDLVGGEVIGKLETKQMPKPLWEGGTLRLRKIGQLEWVELRSQRISAGGKSWVDESKQPRARSDAKKPKLSPRPFMDDRSKAPAKKLMGAKEEAAIQRVKQTKHANGTPIEVFFLQFVGRVNRILKSKGRPSLKGSLWHAKCSETKMKCSVSLYFWLAESSLAARWQVGEKIAPQNAWAKALMKPLSVEVSEAINRELGLQTKPRSFSKGEVPKRFVTSGSSNPVAPKSAKQGGTRSVVSSKKPSLQAKTPSTVLSPTPRKLPKTMGRSVMNQQPTTQRRPLTSKAPEPWKRRDAPKVIPPMVSAKPVGEGRFLRVTFVRAAIWPVRKDGRCWDFCLRKAGQLPSRGLSNFAMYQQSKTFREASQGRQAPDIRVRLRIGKQERVLEAKNDTLTPSWKNASFVFHVHGKVGVTVSLEDKDMYGVESVGVYHKAQIPMSWWNGGTVLLRSFGQVEKVEIRTEWLRKVPRVATLVPRPLPIPKGVRFVKVTVVKAKLWPLHPKKSCWDACPTLQVKGLPPRGLLKFSDYAKDPLFQKLSRGRHAPDPRVRIQLGRYDVYVTPTLSNTVVPEWNSSHVFRIRGNESMTVTVDDDDETVAHEFLRTYRMTRSLLRRWSHETMGKFHSPHLPPQLIQGGRLILRSFGRVEYLELKIEPLQRVVEKQRCPGVYRVRVAEVEVAPKRANGKPWHTGVGSLQLPSPYVKLKIGSHSLETAVAFKQLKSVYQDSKLIPIQKGMPFSIEVRDHSMGLNLSVDRRIKIPFLPIRIGVGMKKETSSQMIGQTAFLSTCKLIEGARHGMVRLKPFGQTRQLLLFFDKIS